MTDEEYELFYEVFQGAVPPKVVPASYLRINSILTDIKVIIDQNEVMRNRLHGIDNGDLMVEMLDHWWRFNNEEFMDYLWVIYDNAMNEKTCESMTPKPPHNPVVPDEFKEKVKKFMEDNK